MEIRFTCQGHPNIRASHKTTLEFTRDSHLTPRGTCIVGIQADFKLQQMKRFLAALRKEDKLKIAIQSGDAQDSLIAVPNRDFSDADEMVIRTTEFLSSRTFATKASKSAAGLNTNLKRMMKTHSITVSISAEGCRELGSCCFQLRAAPRP